jgi:hypothetical protein
MFGWSLHIGMPTFIPNTGKPVNNVICHITLRSTNYISYNLELSTLVDFESP